MMHIEGPADRMGYRVDDAQAAAAARERHPSDARGDQHLAARLQIVATIGGAAQVVRDHIDRLER
jgi:hypothetical protein